MNDTKVAKKSPVYYGWYIVAATMFISFVGVGTRQGFGVFVIPMSEDFGWSRGTISLAASLGVLLNGLIQPFMGVLLDRFGGRKLIVFSLILLGFATISLAFTFHILYLIFVYGILSSVALGGMSITTTGAMLSKWFRRRRATALSLSSAGLSMGALILVPFAMYLLLATNWRITWAVLGLLVLLLALPLAIVFLRDDPAKLGLLPDGDAAPPEEADGKKGKSARGPLEADGWRESFRSMPIWQMTASYFVCGATTSMLSVHFVPYALALGVSPGRAALAFGLMMALNVVGAIGAGMLSDRFSRKNLLALTYFVRGCAYILLLVLPGEMSLWAFASVAGFSWIASAPLTTSLTADVYGVKAIGTITGVTFLFHAVGGFFAILLAGYLFDLTGSYTLPFAIAGVMLFPAALSAFTIRERKYSMRYAGKPAVAVGAGD